MLLRWALVERLAPSNESTFRLTQGAAPGILELRKSFVRTIFNYFRQSSDPALEAEFQRSYYEPSPRDLQKGMLLGIFAFGVFWVSDYLTGKQPAVGGVQTLRLVLMVVLPLAMILIAIRPQRVRDHYTSIANGIFVSLLATLMVLIFHLKTASDIEFYWAIDSSLCTGILVIYGSSRLPVFNTAVLLVVTSIGAVVYSLEVAGPHVPARLVVHLIIFNVVGFAFRSVLETRERDLFLLAKENAREATARVAAEDADAAKSRFLAVLSHELRTPMNGVIQVIEAVSPSASSSDRRLLEKAQEGAVAHLRLLDEMLNFSQSGHVTPAPVDLRDLCHSIERLHGPMAAKKGLPFQVKLDVNDDHRFVVVDPLMLAGIINNLVDNALKFTSVGSVALAVRLDRPADHALPNGMLRLKVTDTGIGIAEADHSRVFLPFYQVNSQPNRTTRGVGLGMAIVEKYATLLQGEISVTSAVGRGTTVDVSLPVHFDAEPTAQRQGSI